MSIAESYKCRLYTPVYENEQKRGRNKSMETTTRKALRVRGGYANEKD